jgi:hypothetical protein
VPRNISTRIIHKHDIEANWLKATGFVPMQGELIIYDIEVDASGNILELPSGRTEPYTYERFKIGDGKTVVSDLPECGSTGIPANYELITVADIDTICGTIIQDTTISEVTF